MTVSNKSSLGEGTGGREEWRAWRENCENTPTFFSIPATFPVHPNLPVLIILNI